MSSIVLDLQKEVLEPDCDILNALRKAHLIASKLKLKEFDAWLRAELNGYSYRDKEKIPSYRNVKGALKAFNPYNGWINAQCRDDEFEKMICEQKLWQPISEIQELYKRSPGGSFVFQFPASQMEAIASMSDTPIPMQFALHISAHLLKSIIEQVKNCILEWTIRLESEGILGKGMRFSEAETVMAKRVPQQVNNYYGTVVNGSVNRSQVVSGDNNTVTYNTAAVADAVREIKESFEAEHIAYEDKESALEILEDISAKLEQNKKPGIIKSVLIGLKDFAVDVGANVTATLITAKLKGLF